MSVLLPNGMMIQDPSSVKLVKVVVDSRGKTDVFIVVIKLSDDSELPVDHCTDEASALKLSDNCTDIINGTLDWLEVLDDAEANGSASGGSGGSSGGSGGGTGGSGGSGGGTGGSGGSGGGTGGSAGTAGKPSASSKKSSPSASDDDDWDDWGDEDDGPEVIAAAVSATSDGEEQSESEHAVVRKKPVPVDEDSDEWPFDDGTDDWY